VTGAAGAEYAGLLRITGVRVTGRPEVIEEVLGYLRFVVGTVRSGRAAGLSPLEAARQADMGEYALWTDPERVVGNLHRAYFELAGGDRGAPADNAAAMRDMIAYNGGRPLSCHA
jgi:cyclase